MTRKFAEYNGFAGAYTSWYIEAVRKYTTKDITKKHTDDMHEWINRHPKRWHMLHQEGDSSYDEKIFSKVVKLWYTIHMPSKNVIGGEIL